MTYFLAYFNYLPYSGRARQVFSIVVYSPRGLDGSAPVGFRGEAPIGDLAEAVCRHCLQILTAGMMKI